MTEQEKIDKAYAIAGKYFNLTIFNSELFDADWVCNTEYKLGKDIVELLEEVIKIEVEKRRELEKQLDIISGRMILMLEND